MTTSLSITSFCLLAGFGSIALGLLMAFLSLFLITLVLLQRGRGGGLSGALGGAGGQSAFGSKAGDTFTVLTISLAGIWIFVCAFAMWSLGMHAPSVANIVTPIVEAGPGSDDTEDIASGLVIPTGNDLIPAEEKADAGLESPVEMAEPAPAEKTEAPAAEKPVTEAPATEKPAAAETPPDAEKPAAAEAPATESPSK